MAKLKKPAGWKQYSDHWYANERRAAGVYYKCAYCGFQVLGSGMRTAEHATSCEKRKAYLAELAALQDAP
jgi:hypothetical protein